MRNHASSSALIAIFAIIGLFSACRQRVEPGTPPPHHGLMVAPVLVPTIATQPLVPVALPRATPVRRSRGYASIALKARLLLITATEADNTLAAIRQTLDDLGTPYDVYVSSKTPGGLTSALLASGSTANYQGVILTTSGLGYAGASGWTTSLTTEEWNTLWQFEATYQVRQVTWYTYPEPRYGFEYPSATTDTTDPAPSVSGAFTSTGAALFAYANTDNPVVVKQALVYLAKPASALLPELTSTEVELTDSAGNALALIARYADGRENLALTFDSNQYLNHTLELAYGLVSWVTRGLFIGERHELIAAQVDDIFLDSDIYPETGLTYRISSSDATALLSWQSGVNSQPYTQDLRLQLAFNGAGASASDSLTATLVAQETAFTWISHTYTHQDLDVNDDGSHVGYGEVVDELNLNIGAAQSPLGLDSTLFNPINLVTPGISGLTNPDAMKAAFDVGVRFLVSDTSRIASFETTTPNTATPNPLQPGILEIPRRPTNLFYNVSSPTEWVAEYNHIFGVGGVIPPPAGLGVDSTFEEILERESDTLLRYLLRGSLNPWMFHQANLRAHDGVNSLLSQLIDRTLTKYRSYLRLPIGSQPMAQLGASFLARDQLSASGVDAVIVPGVSITLTVANAATVPVTGLATATSETYGAQTIAHVAIAPGTPLTLPLQ